jgi:hypothetical protein
MLRAFARPLRSLVFTGLKIGNSGERFLLAGRLVTGVSY